MGSKLTLTLKKEVIEEAKKYAAATGHSLSEMVENYFKLLTGHVPGTASKKASPRVEKLRGIVKVKPGFDYKKVLDEERMIKHGV